VYNYAFNANQTGSVTAAAGSARIDRLDVQVFDPAEGDLPNTTPPNVSIIYTAGTPGSGVAAAAPARSHALAYINVPASGGGSPTVTYNAPYTVAAGGILPTPGSAGYPASPSLGQYIDDATTGLTRFNGTGWFPAGVVPASFASRTRTGGTVSLNSTTWSDMAASFWDAGTNDIILGALTGDVIEVCFSGITDLQAIELYLNVTCVTSGTGFGPTGVGDRGIPAWMSASGAVTPIGGSFFRKVVAGDITSGSLTLRLRYRTNSAGTKNLLGLTSSPITWFARNLGQVG
jgi:hypothetical protein